MSTPEIPAEILQSVRDVIDEACLPERLYTNGTVRALTASFSKALLARDQRAAEIARECTITVPLTQGTVDGAVLAAQQIASTILTYDKEPAAPVDDDGDYYRPDASGYSRADEEWFFDMDGKP